MFQTRGWVFRYVAARDWEATLTQVTAEKLRRVGEGKADRSRCIDEAGGKIYASSRSR